MKPILLIKIIFLLIALIACKEESKTGRKNNQNAFIDAIPIPQKGVLEVVIDSRLQDHRDTYEWNLQDLKVVKASSLMSIPESKQIQNMGHDPKVHGFTNAQIFDIGHLYQSDVPKAGIFFGQETRTSPSLYLQTSLPLAYGDWPVWGFEDEQSHIYYIENLKEYLELSSESIWVVDFTYSRLQKSFYWTIGELRHLKSLSLPLHGIDFSSQELVLPKSLERLVVHNARIDENFGEKIKHLKSLKELIFVGCWLDTHSSQPHWGNDNFEELNKPIKSKLDHPVHPFNRIHKHLQILKLVDCDKKLLIATDYYTWPKLNELEIIQSFDYPSEDGVWAFYYLKLEPNDSPHIHKDYFHSLTKFTFRDPKLATVRPISETEKGRNQVNSSQGSFSFPENKDFSTWTGADHFDLAMRRRFDQSDFDFNYSITHIR